ncbi:Glucose dehydrogenase [Eumeta japonica]|uniref:Glucose dehydrogenase n=1 Tax=Eumeta variegata TaxID=151549 RepID=A0A4C1YCU8_EUMVA|nr:Glucose dehydrogenase [Eumeta japonica]
MTDKNILNGPTKSYHDVNGPSIIKSPSVNNYFLEKESMMLKAFEELGEEIREDPNVPDEIGQSKNFSSTVATGAEIILSTGEKIEVCANKEVIVSAGVFKSPQLLMLSGVGPREVLEKFDIPVVMENPKVGRNFHDHTFAAMAVTGELNPATSLDTALSLIDLGTFPLPLTTGWLNVDKQSTENSGLIQHVTFAFGSLSPILFYACPVTFNYNKTVCGAIFKENILREVVFNNVALVNPKSRGYVTLNSADPMDAPLIFGNTFEVESDLEMLAEGCQRVYDLTKTSYFKKVGGCFIRPPLPECDSLDFGSKSYWKCYARVMANSLYQPAGTCMMDPNGVVDSDLKVHGLEDTGGRRQRNAEIAVGLHERSCPGDSRAQLISLKRALSMRLF